MNRYLLLHSQRCMTVLSVPRSAKIFRSYFQHLVTEVFSKRIHAGESATCYQRKEKQSTTVKNEEKLRVESDSLPASTLAALYDSIAVPRSAEIFRSCFQHVVTEAFSKGFTLKEHPGNAEVKHKEICIPHTARRKKDTRYLLLRSHRSCSRRTLIYKNCTLRYEE